MKIDSVEKLWEGMGQDGDEEEDDKGRRGKKSLRCMEVKYWWRKLQE